MRSSVRRTIQFVSLLAPFVLSACASGTPYQPIGTGNASGGYYDKQLATNRFEVTFSGNTLTSRDTVEGYLHYRAAELTTEQGYDWFAVENRELKRDARTTYLPDPLYHPWYGPTYLYWTPSWRYYRMRGWINWNPYNGNPFRAAHVDMRTVERFKASAEITLHHGVKPVDNAGAFDARTILQTLANNVRRPQT